MVALPFASPRVRSCIANIMFSKNQLTPVKEMWIDPSQLSASSLPQVGSRISQRATALSHWLKFSVSKPVEYSLARGPNIARRPGARRQKLHRAVHLVPKVVTTRHRRARYHIPVSLGLSKIRRPACQCQCTRTAIRLPDTDSFFY
jgi:hypothetical protein